MAIIVSSIDRGVDRVPKRQPFFYCACEKAFLGGVLLAFYLKIIWLFIVFDARVI